MMLQMLSDDPRQYFAIVLTVIVSIVLHELAHGFAAIYKGDRTPIETGHMTGNPLVHMPPVSIIMLLVVGIAWGSMPIMPSRLRGKYAEAFVAVAGPAMNLVLSLIALTALALWMRFSPDTFFASDNHMAENGRVLLMVFGMMNMALFLFNLLPIPPLDGSKIVANFVPAYERFAQTEAGRGAMFAVFMIVFFVSGSLIFKAASSITLWYVDRLVTILH
ncbi:MAG: site-2 protease family protein [Tepidisphaeraceae bacterium]